MEMSWGELSLTEMSEPNLCLVPECETHFYCRAADGERIQSLFVKTANYSTFYWICVFA